MGGHTVALVRVLRDVAALHIVNHCDPLPAGKNTQ